MIIPVPFIGGWFVGSGLAIIAGTRPEKRKKYAIKALGFYFGLFTGYLGVIFLDILVAHFQRRRDFKLWKRFIVFKREFP